MTDRALLEAAARAAGIELVEANAHIPSGGCWIVGADGNDAYWNPLDPDQGHALRLAVRLRMDIMVYDHHVEVVNGRCDMFTEPLGDSPDAATCRAIVRAAAAMVDREA